MKLHQLIAAEKAAKSRAEAAITVAYHQLQKPALYAGLSRRYFPKDDEGDQLPPEATLTQLRVDTVLDDAARAMARILDLAATKDEANTLARGDIEVDGEVLAADVPVTTLLTIEKRLTDLRTLIAAIPTLDPTERWHVDQTTGLWATDEVLTTRTRKVPQVLVKAQATDKHPAQVDVYMEDVVAGYWHTVKFSGALPATRVANLLRRIDRLTTAVKVAREAANQATVVDVEIGGALLAWVLRP